MTKFNWLVTIKNCLFALKCTGVWPNERKAYSLNLYTLYAIIALTIFIVADTIFQSIMIYFIINDLAALAASIYILPSKLGTIFKIFIFTSNIQTVQQLTEEVNSDVFQPVTEKQKLLIENNLWAWSLVFKIMWMSTGVGLIFYFFFPLLDKTENHKLLFPSWYPFDSKKSPFYEITYVYQALSLIYVASVNTNIDMFLSALNMYIGCQFDLLSNNLQNLEIKNERNIIKIFRHHQHILKYSLNTKYKFLFLVISLQIFTKMEQDTQKYSPESISSKWNCYWHNVVPTNCGKNQFLSLTIKQQKCINILQIPVLTIEFLAMLMVETAVLTEIFMFCWFGNQVQVKVFLSFKILKLLQNKFKLLKERLQKPNQTLSQN